MKLILKLPEGKPPFVGVLLKESDNRSYPERLNEDLINEHKYAGYCLTFEFTNNLLNLALVSAKGDIVRHYKDVEFEGAQLASWVYATRNASSFNFGHVRIERGKECIVKTWGKKINFVLAVQSYDVRDEFQLRSKQY